MPTGYRVTLDTFKNRLNALGNGYVVRDDISFKGMNYPVSVICPTHPDFDWSPLANNLLSSCSRCPKCANNYKLTASDVINKLKGTTVEYVKGFINTQLNATFRCLNNSCNYEWLAKPNNVITGTRCGKCSGNIKVTNAEVDLRLTGRDVVRVGDIKRTTLKMDFKCTKCSYQWLSTPTNIFSGNGCPNCATGGFDYSKEGFLYYARILINDTLYYKIGITNRSVGKRLKEYTDDYEVLETYHFNIGRDAHNIEQVILRKLSEYLQSDGKFSGHRECFTKDIRQFINLKDFIETKRTKDANI